MAKKKVKAPAPAKKTARPVPARKRTAKKKVQPIPKGYRTVTPYLVVNDAAGLIEFLKKGFGAKEKFRSAMPDGTVMHAEVQIGDSMVMIGGAKDESGATTAMIYLYVKDVDAVYKKAVAAGGQSIMAPADQFYGDRNGGVKDAHGNQWWIGTHVEDVSPKEMARRMKEMGKGQ